MSRFVVEAGEREGEALVVLRDTETGAKGQIWPGCGFNLFSLTLPDPKGAAANTASSGGSGPSGDGAVPLITVIEAPPSLSEIRRRPSWWGVPLLFPFPGTIPRGEYVAEGQKLRLGRPEQPVVSEGKEFPGARRDYHGFVMDLPWKVVERRGDDTGATVRAELDSRDHPEAHEGFPFPYKVSATYRLDAKGVRLDFGAENVGDGRLPFGFGAHPFFKVPLGPKGSAEECLLRVPASRRWNARAVRDRLEAGESAAGLTWEEVTIPVPAELDLREPRRWVSGTFNGMFTGLERVGPEEVVEAFIRDPNNGVETVMRASREFPNVVVWSPPGRPEVCFEPWICPSNVFNLAASGVPGNGLVRLEPGETWGATMWVGLRAAGS